MAISKNDIEQLLEKQREHYDDKFESLAENIAEIKDQTKDIPDMKRKLDVVFDQVGELTVSVEDNKRRLQEVES